MVIYFLTITLCLLLSLDSGHGIKIIRMGAGLVGRGYATKSENCRGWRWGSREGVKCGCYRLFLWYGITVAEWASKGSTIFPMWSTNLVVSDSWATCGLSHHPWVYSASCCKDPLPSQNSTRVTHDLHLPVTLPWPIFLPCDAGELFSVQV